MILLRTLAATSYTPSQRSISDSFGSSEILPTTTYLQSHHSTGSWHQPQAYAVIMGLGLVRHEVARQQQPFAFIARSCDVKVNGMV